MRSVSNSSETGCAIQNTLNRISRSQQSIRLDVQKLLTFECPRCSCIIAQLPSPQHLSRGQTGNKGLPRTAMHESSPEPTARLQIRLFGGFSVEVGGRPADPSPAHPKGGVAPRGSRSSPTASQS